jgi:hypothetical protein
MNGSHGTADTWCMSGRKFNPALTYPCYGSVISQQRGFASALLPFVQLGNSLDRCWRRLRNSRSRACHSKSIPIQPSGILRFRYYAPKGIESRGAAFERLASIDSLQRQADLQPTELTR